jgi:SNF2 family DNA or RNA helicase
MKNKLLKLKSILNWLLTFLPSPLPVGVKEFESWSSSIIQAYGLPDNDSVRFALATQIMHLGPTEANKPRRYFGLCLLKGAATQVAYGVMGELKEKQKREEEARQKAAQDELSRQEISSTAS